MQLTEHYKPTLRAPSRRSLRCTECPLGVNSGRFWLVLGTSVAPQKADIESRHKLAGPLSLQRGSSPSSTVPQGEGADGSPDVLNRGLLPDGPEQRR